MSEFLFFIIGTMLGGLFGVVCMCCLQINRLSERKEEDNAKKKCADTFPSDTLMSLCGNRVAQKKPF